MPESPLNLEQPATSLRTTPRVCNQPNIGACFALTTFRPEMNTKTPRSATHEVPSSSSQFVSERSEQNQDINMPVIKNPSSKQQNEIAIETNEVTVDAGTVCEGAIQQRDKGKRDFPTLDIFRRNGKETDKFRPVSEDYLQPVENNNLQSAVINTGSSKLCDGKAESLTHSRPQPKPRVKTLDKIGTDNFFQRKHSTFTGTLLSLQTTDMLESNPLCDREAAQQCTSVKPADQPNPLIPTARSRHQLHGYQNDTLTTAPRRNALRPAGSVEPPYTRVLSDTNWEVPRDHLSLFERIGGGSFGQVWKGFALDVAGAKGWSVVAVKMLKGKED